VPVSISRAVANSVCALYGRNVHSPVIYNGVATADFSGAAKRARGCSTVDDVVLLHIGRFFAEKNHALLAEAFAMAAQERGNMRLWFIGDGPLRAAIEKAVSQRGLADQTSFLGTRADVAELLAECDVLVLSSDYEGLGLTVLEAMAAAKPVAATAVGGVPELVENGVSGILVPRRDPEALARAILRLARDPELRRRMGQEGQRRALARFDISRTAREYEALYLEFLKEGRKS